jgi:hypothetical protein
MSHPMPSPPSKMPGRLPDVLVIGTIKGGTSALYHYLRHHPQVAASREKELNFFLEPGILPPDPRGFDRGGWNLGVGWYRRWFQSDRPICCEASPNYSLGTHAERVAERIATVVPRARLVYLVRNPLDRLRSHYLMTLKRPGSEPLSFSDYLTRSDAIATSCYGAVVESYLRHVSRDRILVLESAALDVHRRESLSAIFRFMGVAADFWCSEFERRVYVGSRRPCVSLLGARFRDSAAMRALRGRLSPSLYYHVENAALWPFRVPEPSLGLPRGQAAAIVERLQLDVRRLRELTDLALPSLDVTMEQALSSTPGREG